MKNLHLAALLYIMVLTVSCSSIHDVSYDYDRQADLASLRTYYWLAMPEGVKTAPFFGFSGRCLIDP